MPGIYQLFNRNELAEIKTKRRNWTERPLRSLKTLNLFTVHILNHPFTQSGRDLEGTSDRVLDFSQTSSIVDGQEFF